MATSAPKVKKLKNEANLGPNVYHNTQNIGIYNLNFST